MNDAPPPIDALVTGAITRGIEDAAQQARLRAAWRQERAQEPDQIKALRMFTRVLRREKQVGLVRDLASAVAETDAHGAAFAAEMFSRLGDHAEALRIAGDFHERFPKSQQAKRLYVEALIGMGREAEAAALLETVPAKAAGAKWVKRAHETLASVEPAGAAPDANAAAQAAALVAEAQAHQAAERFADAEQVVAAALKLAPGNIAGLRLSATLAEQRGELDEALRRWSALRTRAPRSPAGYVGGLRCLRRFNRLDLAPPILAAGREKLWDNADFVILAAQTAAAGKAIAEADAWWQRAIALVPDNPRHALSAATVLSGPRKGRKQRLGTVLVRLEQHHERFPDYAPAYTAHIDALRNLGRFDEAERLSAKWCARFPTEIDLIMTRAGLHEEQGQFDKALDDVAALHARVPATPELEAAYIRALSCAGQHDAAEQHCAAARAATPRDRGIWLQYARLASRRGDWELCAARLREGLQALPDDDRLTRELQTVRLQLAEPEPGEPAPETAANVFARFESLGGSGMGCEFGMVQRRQGSDTVGLLRWARTNPPELIDALEHEFDGVGAEENTELATARLDVDREEYVTRDKRYMMESHTFVRTTDAPAERMYQQTCRRLRFLRGKMLEDLRAAEKIFVYRSQDALDDDSVTAIHTALARYGDAALLCVMRAPEGATGGTLRILARGVFVGYVSYFARDESGATGLDVESWSAVCVKADAAWRQTLANESRDEDRQDGA